MSSTLTQEQKNTVAEWVRDGATLSEVQKRIADEFEISMTYMDVRFLVDDLDLVLKDKEPEPVKTPPSPEPSPDDAVTDAASPVEQPTQNADDAASPAGNSNVTLSVDPIQRPGVVLGGSVTFSDGQTGQWQLDQHGQLGFVPPVQGYQPSPADIREFQAALQRELAKLGY